MKLLFLLLYSTSLLAFDSDQRPLKCGKYQAFAKIYCHKVDVCQLLVGESKLSKLVIELASNGKNLSYFSGYYIKVEIELLKLKDGFKGRALKTPIQQFGAIKKAGMELKEAASCK